MWLELGRKIGVLRSPIVFVKTIQVSEYQNIAVDAGGIPRELRRFLEVLHKAFVLAFLTHPVRLASVKLAFAP